ncbi:hypothetical protein KBB05_02795, partial [Patescibacteria group bacterium]|nr:hypothetical protein [Patescibacteria group bacterium]
YYFSRKIVTITAKGIAMITPLIPIVIPPNTMHKKITTGLTHRFCLNKSGIKTLFSIRCTTNTTIHEIKNHVQPYHTVDKITTGIHHNNGPR